MLKQLKDDFSRIMEKEFGIDKERAMQSFESNREEFGELSTNIAFVISKEQKKNPVEIAKKLGELLSKNPMVEGVKLAGPYVNISLKSEFYAKVLEKIKKEKEKYGSGKKIREKIIVEFPSVNPNKPWHIGHLRNALLGDSISNILEFYGYDVERIDYINDLGLQVAQSLWGYLNENKEPEKKFDHWLGEKYVLVAKKFEQDGKTEKQVRELIKKMEGGDEKITKQAREMVEECIKAQYETKAVFRISHDALIFESDIMDTIFEEGMGILRTNSSLVQETEGKNAGCFVVRLRGEFPDLTEPDKILIRSDGTATYTAKDIIFHMWKFGFIKDKFKYLKFVKQANGKTAFISSRHGKIRKKFAGADKILNIIGVEQTYTQQVNVEVLSKLGYLKNKGNYIHLSYGHAELPGGKFSGREGTWMGYSADDLISEAKKEATEKIKEEVEDKEGIADAVGIGAIKYSFLRISPEKKLIFRWEDSMNMEGDSGPYIQYAYVRTCGILSKASNKINIHEEYSYSEEEKRLIRKMGLFEEIVQKCAKSGTVHPLCEYLVELSNIFNKFYATHVILKEEGKTRDNRVSQVYCCNIVLKTGLGLLGIRTVERM